jgi:DegV family protein with EDD domain
MTTAPADPGRSPRASARPATASDLDATCLADALRAGIHRVFALAAGVGTVTGQKADDMQRQTRAAHHARAQRVAIVTDSAADIPEELIDQLGIHVVPLRIHFGSRSYLDKVTMTPTEFYQELARNPEHPKTSQPPPGDFRRMFEFLASHYEHVVAITLSAKVRGTHDAALAATQRVAPGPNGRPVVTVIDSRSVSCGQGLVALAAAERARSGAMATEIVAAAREAVARTQGFALLTDLHHAVKGGRVPGAARRFADLLRMSVVLVTTPDGQVKAGGALFGRRRVEPAFARYVARRSLQDRTARPSHSSSTSRPSAFRLMIGHGGTLERATALAQELRARLWRGAIVATSITDMGTALGVHGGPGALIVGLQQEPA